MQNSDETASHSTNWRLIAQSGVRYFEWYEKGVRMFYSIRGSEQDFLKKKAQQRADEHKKREIAKKEAKKKGQAARKKMEREMRQRRSEELGVQA